MTPPASAGVGLSAPPDFTSPTVPGQVAPATLTITNSSTGAEAIGPVTITDITLIPSCANQIPGCPTPDPGVFALNGPFVGTGSAGAICPTAYTVTVINAATGEVRFTPVGGPPVLLVGQMCFISFTTTTLRAPTFDADPAAPGRQTALVGSLAGVAANGATGDGSGRSFAAVNPAPSSIDTTASPPRTDPGEGFSDVATVTGVPSGPRPTGTVTFQVFGPTSIGSPGADASGFPTCVGTPFGTSAPIVLPAAGPVTVGSGMFGIAPPSTPGNYVFVATYSGDASYTGSTSPCNDVDERVTVESLPTIAIVKSATPTSMLEPGGTFTFNLTVTNTSGEPLTITTLTDTVQGVPSVTTNLNGRGTCAIGALLAADSDGTGPLIGGTYSCSFPGTFTGIVTGPIDPTQIDTATVVGTDADGNTATASADATVTLTAAPPTIVVDKTASPGSLPEPGGGFTFNVVVRNTTVRPVTILSLIDNVYGNLDLPDPNPDPRVTNNTCAGAVGTVLPADPDGADGLQLGGSFTCSFVGAYISNTAGQVQVDTVQAVAVDIFGNRATDIDEASVTVTDVLPTIVVVKTAAPASLPEPSGAFTFSVVVTNTSVEPVTVTTLTDNVYGNLNLPIPDPRVTNNTCGGSVGRVLAADLDGAGPAPGGSFTCSFVGTYTTDVAGRPQVDIVRAVAVDSENNSAEDSDDASVFLTDVLPTILVDKDATPATRLEPGGLFTYNVVVTNTSVEPVTITSLTDSVYGNLNQADPNQRVTANTCAGAVGRVLGADPDGAGPAPGGTFTCTFKATFEGVAGDSELDTVTVVGVDSENNPATDTDTAVVSITNVVPTIVVEKTAPVNTLPEPGGNFTFNVVVTNTSIIPVTITSLNDSVYGNLNLVTPGPRITNNTCAGAVGTVLAGSGGRFTCSFRGSFTGISGAFERDVVTAVVIDEGGEQVTDDDDETVTLTNLPPTITVDKTATPGSRPEPTGIFRFAVVVANTGIERVRITVLDDDVYGDLNSATNPLVSNNTCVGAIGRFLAPDSDGPGPLTGGSFSCAFDGSYTGNAGEDQRDVVTAVVVDDQNTPGTDTDDAIVTLTNVPPTVQVVKTATPESRPAPGGAFTFNVVVTNTSTEDVTITALTDDVYGNIATQGTCTDAIGTLLSPQETYTCAFTGNFTGVGGSSQKDIVTVVVTDDDDSTATDSDDATVTMTATVVGQNVAPPAVTNPPTANSPTPNRTVVQGPAPTLPKTGAGVADLVTVALDLLTVGGLLLLAGSRWVPAAGASPGRRLTS